MSIPSVTDLLTELTQSAVVAAKLDHVLPDIEAVVATRNPKFGDFQSNQAFRIGRAMKGNPRAVAEQVKEALPEHPGVEKVDVAGPGFLNFHLSDAWLSERLIAQAKDPHLGIRQSGNKKTVVIDYSSPNVAKRMHIGHMRSTIIGNAIDRIYRSMGWRVVADNHIGDWGTQFGKLIVSWRDDFNADAFQADPIGELERLYVRFGQNETPELAAAARAETAKLQHGDVENLALWRQFIDVSMREFNKVYDRLGVVFDETLGESAYNEALSGVVAGLLESNIATQSDGAVVVAFPKGTENKRLSETVLVIRKKDGAHLYGTTDLATLEHRMETWDPAEIVYVTDTRQQLHFQQVFAAWNKWRAARSEAIDLKTPKLIHTWFGMLKLPEGAMSTRKGNVIRLVDLLDEAIRRAKAVVDEKSPDLSADLREHIAEAVGVSAIRYSDLSQNPQSDVTFEWNRILSLEGNTAPFLMYSYARGRGIQRKGGVADPSVEHLIIDTTQARELALQLLKFPGVVELSQSQGRPNLICDHLYETATAFNRFYFSNKVLTAETDALKQSRLSMVEATLRVLEKGFGLLGLVPLERM